MEEPAQEEYILHIKAVSFGTPLQSNKTSVKITVPLNLPPRVDKVYTFSLLENVTVGTMVGRVNSTDPNTENGQVDRLSYTMDVNETGAWNIWFNITF